MGCRERYSMKTPYERSLEYSNRALAQMRCRLEALPLGDRAVLVCGSYARREASESSGVDFFMVSESVGADSSLIESVRAAIKEVAPNEPSPDGAFGGSVDRRRMIENIGGENCDRSQAGLRHAASRKGPATRNVASRMNGIGVTGRLRGRSPNRIRVGSARSGRRDEWTFRARPAGS